MSRTERHEPVDVPATTKYETVVAKTCDRCGTGLTDDWQDTNKVAQTLEIFLNPDECVAFRRRRDYCPPCSVDIWEAVNLIIGANPHDEYDPDINEWYG